MSRFSQMVAVFLVTAGFAGGGTELSPEVLLLSRIERTAREGLLQIPAYVCQETVERYTRGSRFERFRKLDAFTVQVAQIGDREMFARPGDSAFQDKPLADMVRPGMVATGIFYAMAHAVFLQASTVFHYQGPEKRSGHKAVRYDFRIAQIFSSYQIAANGFTDRVGTEGSIWADSATANLLELEVRALDIPPQMRIRNTTTKIVYSATRLGERTYLIPLTAEIKTVSANGTEDQNRTAFRDCHRYTGESKITF